MTLQEWAALDEDVEGELVDGMLEGEELSTFLHELVVDVDSRRPSYLGTPLPRLRRGSATKLAVGPRRGRKPDLALFLPHALPALSDELIRVPPHLVVEVASPRPRDVHRDRVDKLTDYARAGIRLYAIVDPQPRSLEVYELGRDGRYAVACATGRGRVRVPGCPGLVLNLDALWKEVDEAERAHARGARRRRW